MPQEELYRKLTCLNARIVRGRDLIGEQRDRIIASADDPSPQSVILFRELQRSVRCMSRHRRRLMAELRSLPD